MKVKPSRCDDCGKFIGMGDFAHGRCDFTPLNEFGPEVIEWTCGRCVAAQRLDRSERRSWLESLQPQSMPV